MNFETLQNRNSITIISDWFTSILTNTRHTSSGVAFKKYKTFSVLIYSYINTSGNWKTRNCVFKQFRVFLVFTSVDVNVYQSRQNALYFFYNIAQKTLTKEWREIFRWHRVISTRLLVDQRLQMLYYRKI